MNASAIMQAHRIFKSMCTAFDKRELKYQTETESFTVKLQFSGEDISFDISLSVIPETQLLTVNSKLPFTVSAEKIEEISLATSMANCEIAFGNFDFNYRQREVSFRSCMSIEECIIGDGCFNYLLDSACFAVERYNDKFVGLNLGFISLEEFV